MGGTTPTIILFRHCFFWTIPFFDLLHCAWPGWPAIQILSRSQELDRLIHCFKRWPLFRRRIRTLPEKWEKGVTNNRQYFQYYMYCIVSAFKSQTFWRPWKQGYTTCVSQVQIAFSFLKEAGVKCSSKCFSFSSKGEIMLDTFYAQEDWE